MNEIVHFILRVVVPCKNIRPMEKIMKFHEVEFGQNELEFCFWYDGYEGSTEGIIGGIMLEYGTI